MIAIVGCGRHHHDGSVISCKIGVPLKSIINCAESPDETLLSAPTFGSEIQLEVISEVMGMKVDAASMGSNGKKMMQAVRTNRQAKVRRQSAIKVAREKVARLRKKSLAPANMRRAASRSPKVARADPKVEGGGRIRVVA